MIYLYVENNTQELFKNTYRYNYLIIYNNTIRYHIYSLHLSKLFGVGHLVLPSYHLPLYPLYLL